MREILVTLFAFSVYMRRTVYHSSSASRRSALVMNVSGHKLSEKFKRKQRNIFYCSLINLCNHNIFYCSLTYAVPGFLDYKTSTYSDTRTYLLMPIFIMQFSLYY